MGHNDHTPTIRVLDRETINGILQRNSVGRIGYIKNGRMEIRPVHYVFSDGWLYGRTSFGAGEGGLGETGRHGKTVVFEVDEVEELFRWRSVVIHGGFYIIQRDNRGEYETWMKALGLLRTLVPETLRRDDPVPDRTELFRIAIEEASGREATPEAP